MSIYANIEFEMKDGYEAPALPCSQCGEFRDTVLNLIEMYDEKHGNKTPSQKIVLSGDELIEFGKHYAEEVEFEKMSFQIENVEFDEIEEKEVSVCQYYKNNKFTIDDHEIFGYHCLNIQSFMPVYHRFENWASANREHHKNDFDKNLAIFKRYVQLTLEAKMLFGVQISKIKSVSIELC